MRIVFLGTPVEASVCLDALHRAGHDVALVVTQPDRRRGRGGDVVPSPVKRTAESLGLRVLTPDRARDTVDDLRESGATLGVVVAFGQLLPPAVLDALPHGFVNVHFSLLPRWRGAAPVERALLAGDDETGVCLMQLEEGLDTGPVYAQEVVPIGPRDTAAQLRAELTEVGARLLVDQLDSIPDATPAPQEGEPTYAEKLSPDEFRLDWSHPAAELDRLVRAGVPKPGAWSTLDGRRVKIHAARPAPAGDGSDEPMPDPGTVLVADDPSVATGEGRLVLERVQPEGKAVMEAAAWARGLRGEPRFE